MIASVEGRLLEKTEDSVILEVAGLGLQLYVSRNTLESIPSAGERVMLYSHLYVREDVLALYGFSTPLEKELFLNLLGITGVGPRMALAILSAYKPEDFLRIVATEDLASITAIPGVGKKSGQRLLMEMRDRLGPQEMELARGRSVPGEDIYRDAREALRNLGYTSAEAARALEGFQAEGKSLTVEDLLKYALSRMARD